MDDITNIAIANKLQNLEAYKTFQEAMVLRNRDIDYEIKKIEILIKRYKNEGRLGLKSTYIYDEMGTSNPAMYPYDKKQIEKYFKDKGYIVNFNINQEKTGIELIISWNFTKENY